MVLRMPFKCNQFSKRIALCASVDTRLLRIQKSYDAVNKYDEFISAFVSTVCLLFSFFYKRFDLTNIVWTYDWCKTYDGNIKKKPYILSVRT